MKEGNLHQNCYKLFNCVNQVIHITFSFLMLKQVCRLSFSIRVSFIVVHLFTCTRLYLVSLQFSVQLGISQSLGSRLLLF